MAGSRGRKTDTKPTTQPRALRVELVKPLDRDWSDVGGHLRALRFAAHWVINEAVLASIESANRIARGEQKLSAKEAANGNAGVVAPATAAYRAAEEIALPACRAWAATKLKGKKKNGTTDETTEQQRESGLLQRVSVLEVPGGIRSAWAQHASAMFQKWSKMRGSERIPSTGKGAPIIVRGSEVKLTFDPKGVVLSLALYAGRGSEVRFAVKCGKGDHYGRLKEMAHGKAGHGDVKLLYDERQKKWFAMITYLGEPAKAPPKCDPKRALVVHRGRRNALYLVCDDGRFRPEPGAKLMATKRRLVARRLSMQHISRDERGSGCHGHGRIRRYAAPECLQEREANVVATWCQQMGAAVVKAAKAWGCGTIIIEDYGGIEQTGDAEQRYLGTFPLYQLKTSIAWALAKIGMELTEVPAEYISSTCPMCGNADARQHNHRTGIFHCARPACGFERHADYVAAFNMMLRAGHGDGLRKRLKKEYELVAKIGEAAE